MFNRLIIVGAGGHGKVIADIALKLGYRDIAFADDHAKGSLLEYPIICTSDEIEQYNDSKTDFVIAVGNNKIRKKIAQKHKINWVSLIHPSVQIGTDVKIGAGTVVMAGAVINPCAVIGMHCILNTCSVVEHDNVIEDYVHLSPRAALGGTVHVGEGTHIGIGASVKNNIAICKNCTIGAGAAVVKDIEESAVYVGVPARKLQ